MRSFTPFALFFPSFSLLLSLVSLIVKKPLKPGVLRCSNQFGPADVILNLLLRQAWYLSVMCMMLIINLSLWFAWGTVLLLWAPERTWFLTCRQCIELSIYFTSLLRHVLNLACLSCFCKLCSPHPTNHWMWILFNY